jgi:hypothetical protein
MEESSSRIWISVLLRIGFLEDHPVSLWLVSPFESHFVPISCLLPLKETRYKISSDDWGLCFDFDILRLKTMC